MSSYRFLTERSLTEKCVSISKADCARKSQLLIGDVYLDDLNRSNFSVSAVYVEQHAFAANPDARSVFCSVDFHDVTDDSARSLEFTEAHSAVPVDLLHDSCERLNKRFNNVRSTVDKCAWSACEARSRSIAEHCTHGHRRRTNRSAVNDSGNRRFQFELSVVLTVESYTVVTAEDNGLNIVTTGLFLSCNERDTFHEQFEIRNEVLNFISIQLLGKLVQGLYGLR